MAFGSYGILSNEYICHALRSPYFLAYTLQCGYGVKMPRLSTTDACNGFIPLPPLEEQERIVTEIQRLFSIIDIVEGGKEDLKVAIQAAKSKILDLAIHASSSTKIRMTNLPLNCSNASILRPKSYLITGIIRSCHLRYLNHGCGVDIIMS